MKSINELGKSPTKCKMAAVGLFPVIIVLLQSWLSLDQKSEHTQTKTKTKLNKKCVRVSHKALERWSVDQHQALCSDPQL